MKVRMGITDYKINKEDMLGPAEINMTFQVTGVKRSKFTPTEELKIIESVINKLSAEGVEIADNNLNVEVSINDLAKNVEKEMRHLKSASRVW